MSDDYVFLMLRNVSSSFFNNYWIECYTSIRKYYPDKHIKIIDTGSVPEYVSCPLILENCEVIASEFPQTRLYSPFYEFLKIDGYKKAVIIHDGIIFNTHVDFNTVCNAKFLWHFETHEYDNYQLESRMLNSMENSSELNRIYSEKAWYGSLGCMVVIDKEFIHKLENTYKFTRLIHLINNQSDAIAFERVVAVLCYAGFPNIKDDISFEGDIKNMRWGYTYNNYIQDSEKQCDKPFFKLFGARK